MLELISDAIVDALHAMPMFRRILLLAILAAAVWFNAIGWSGFAIWAAVFFGFEVASILLPHKR